MQRFRTILGLAILLAATAAKAAPMEHHDLASLWFLADEVVMGDGGDVSGDGHDPVGSKGL